MTKIYALVDPRDRRVRYVGKTRTTLARRLEGHLEKPTNHGMRLWLTELYEVKLRPDIVAIEFVAEFEWEAAERGWISWFRSRASLLNIDPGGEARDAHGELRAGFKGSFLEPSRSAPPKARKPREKKPPAGLSKQGRRTWRKKQKQAAHLAARGTIWERVAREDSQDRSRRGERGSWESKPSVTEVATPRATQPMSCGVFLRKRREAFVEREDLLQSPQGVSASIHE